MSAGVKNYQANVVQKSGTNALSAAHFSPVCSTASEIRKGTRAMPRLHFRTRILNSSKWRRTLAHPSCYETKGERKQREKSLFSLECLG